MMIVDPSIWLSGGTTGSEHSGTRLAIDRSICGLLIAQPALPYFCEDQSGPEYATLYRNYFSASGHQARTEFVFRISHNGQTVGLINIESREANAFSYHHRESLLALAQTFGGFAAVFEQRLNMNLQMQNSVATSTKNYLEALAGTFNHAISTPLASQRTIADLLATYISDATSIVTKMRRSPPKSPEQFAAALAGLDAAIKKLRSKQAEILEGHIETTQFVTDFLNDISNYSEREPLVLRDLILSAVRLADDSLLSDPTKRINIRLARDSSPTGTKVFCSTLAKQHLYSIFHNAVDSIMERMKLDARPGSVTVHIAEAKVPQGQEALEPRVARTHSR